jgi:hypothetical protein
MKESTVIELDSSPVVSLKNKVPIKRHTTSQPNLFDENDNNLSTIEMLKEEIKSSTTTITELQRISKSNRVSTEKEKSWNERLNKNTSILETMYVFAFSLILNLIRLN